MSAPLPIVVLVSGSGSNLRAIDAARLEGRCAVDIRAVVADRHQCSALEWAQAQGLATDAVRPRDFDSVEAWDAALADAIAAHEPGLVVLAGFMRIVRAAVLERFGGRIVNVHPALLPAFPGMDGPAQAIAHGVTLAGCTVHLVDAGVDTGPILAQAACPVLPSDDAASLHRRIQTLEHQLLPSVVDAIASGRLRLDPARAELDEWAPERSLFNPPL